MLRLFYLTISLRISASEIKILAEEGKDTQSSLKMPRIAVFWWKESKTPGAMMV
jgi:hypothetical protein